MVAPPRCPSREFVITSYSIHYTKLYDELVGRSDAEREIQEAAVFALSQRPADEGVPALIGVARDHRDPRIRRQAMFWLGQTQDPRALAFFEEILTGSYNFV